VRVARCSHVRCFILAQSSIVFLRVGRCNRAIVGIGGVGVVPRLWVILHLPCVPRIVLGDRGSERHWTLCTPPRSGRCRIFSQNRPVAPRREPVPKVSTIACCSSFRISSHRKHLIMPYHSRGLVSLDHSARIEGSAHHSFDLIPFGILLRWSAKAVYPCTCGLVRTHRCTQVDLTLTLSRAR
jgi:hypothetical protein